MRTKKYSLIFNIALITLTLAFIWSRSFKSIPASRAESEAVMRWLTPFLEHFVGRGNVTNHLVRKLAHFCEFGLLGVEVSALLLQLHRADVRSALSALLPGIVCAGIDEGVQLFTGRGSRLSDVLLDSCGYAVGVLGLLLLCYCVSALRKKKTSASS